MGEVEIDPRDLSRGQQQKLQRSKSFGELAEELAAEQYDGYKHVPDQSEWYDARHENTGSKMEVKSTSSTIGSKYPGDGRFRVWQGQHQSLTSSDASGTAWYVFVLLDEDAGLLRMRRVKPSTVTQIVRDRGGWNNSGHGSMGKQHKIPHDELF